MTNRWVAAGRSGADDARAAGREAAAEACRGQVDPRLVVVFASDRYAPAELLAGVRDVTGATPLIGCSTAGEIAASGPGDQGVVVTVLGGTGFSVSTSVATAASADLRAAGASVAQCVSDVADRPYRALLLLSDGLSGDQVAVVRGAYSVVGAEVPLVGGCAGDDLRMERTVQLHGDQAVTDAVVAAAIGSDGPIGIGVSHGWREVGSPMLVTDSTDHHVLTLDDEPALDVYLSRLGAPAAAHTDPQAFTRFALTHPLGLERRSGTEVRFISGADFATRSLVCVAQVPRGGLAWFMEGDESSVLAATAHACDDALAPLGDRPPLGLLAFDCIARRGVLGETGIRREIDMVASRAGGAPVTGFYTYGEIARAHGRGGFHNQTLVVLAMG